MDIDAKSPTGMITSTESKDKQRDLSLVFRESPQNEVSVTSDSSESARASIRSEWNSAATLSNYLWKLAFIFCSFIFLS